MSVPPFRLAHGVVPVRLPARRGAAADFQLQLQFRAVAVVPLSSQQVQPWQYCPADPPAIALAVLAAVALPVEDAPAEQSQRPEPRATVAASADAVPLL